MIIYLNHNRNQRLVFKKKLDCSKRISKLFHNKRAAFFRVSRKVKVKAAKLVNLESHNLNHKIQACFSIITHCPIKNKNL